jgi:glutamate synthase domain-containing protein 2
MSRSSLGSIFSLRMAPLVGSVCAALTILLVTQGSPDGAGQIAVIFFVALAILGVYDLLQTEHSILRNYPILGHLRFLLEDIRPEIRQYFFEDETEGYPFSRNKRAVIYQRAKNNLDKRPFGTQLNVYEEGFEWLSHSIAPETVGSHDFRVRVGGPQCRRPYDASLFNISAMSFGALSANALLALNAGAKDGGFAHNTGEGGLSPYHQTHGGDLIWEIGSGYFSCRTPDGQFDPESFARDARIDQVKMIEIKLSQGAKPGHGGLLPGTKVSDEIARIRGVPAGVDCVSPAAHSAFSTPLELIRFVQSLRELSEGKPVGFKLCIGRPGEFFAICKAMLETGILPDFITVDGKEGGTGSAPLEFMDHIGMPMREGLAFVHHTLTGIGLRENIRIAASGKIATGFDIARASALGADWCYSARGFMFALGCIQSLKCHTDRCPTGVATQDPARARALVPALKAERVRNYHRSTMIALAELTAAAGVAHPRDLQARDFYWRASENQIVTLEQLYPPPVPGAFLTGEVDDRLARAWRESRADSFRAAG